MFYIDMCMLRGLPKDLKTETLVQECDTTVVQYLMALNLKRDRNITESIIFYIDMCMLHGLPKDLKMETLVQECDTTVLQDLDNLMVIEVSNTYSLYFLKVQVSVSLLRLFKCREGLEWS